MTNSNNGIITLVFIALMLAPLSVFCQTQFAPEKELLRSDFLQPDKVIVADLNNDDFDDILVHSYNERTLGWIPNNAGEFAEPIQLNFEIYQSSYPHSFGVADFDNNGTNDIIYLTAEDRHLAWRTNLGNGVFGASEIIDSVETSSINSIYLHHPDNNDPLEIYGIESFQIRRYVVDGPTPLTKEILTSTNNTSTRFAIADLNEEVGPEFVYANGWPYNQVIIAFSNSSGNGYSELTYTLNDVFSIRSIETSDIDMDGDEDILLGCNNNASDEKHLILILNDGNNSFTILPGTQELNQDIIEIADLDSDGDPDIITSFLRSNQSGDEVLDWLENDGDGNFSTVNTFDDSWSLLGHRDLAQIDKEKNGINELLLLTTYSSAVKLFSKDANDMISCSEAVSTSYHLPEVIKSIDLDDNGLLDILFLTFREKGLKYCLQTELGVFSEPISFCEELSPISYVRSGESPAMILGSNELPTQFWAITNDSKIHLVDISDFDNLHCSDALFQSDLGFEELFIQDLNNDGFSDLIYFELDEPELLRTAINQNDESFLPGPSIPVNASGLYWLGSSPSMSVMDIDNNGQMELAIVNLLNFNPQEAQLDIYQLNDDEEYEQFLSIVLPEAFNQPALGIADLNGDALHDILFTSIDINDYGLPGSNLYWFLNLGDGNFSEAKFLGNISQSSNIRALSIFDVDKDGDFDFVTDSFTASGLSWCENDGQGNFNFVDQISGETLTYNLTGFTMDVQNASGPDLFGRGTSDFSWLQFSSHCDSKIWRSIPLGDYQRYGISGDFDNDGDMDLVASYRKIVFYENMPGLPRAEFETKGGCGSYCFNNTSWADYSQSDVTWDFGDGTSSTEIHAEKTDYAFGIYTVSLSVCNALGCDTTSIDIEVAHSFDFFIPESAGVNEPIEFQHNTEGFTNYSWVFGDGSISLEPNPTHSYSQDGIYTVELIVTDNSITDCSQIFSQEITIGTPSAVSTNNAQLSLFPNPAKDFSTLDITEFGEATVSIFSILGEKVFQSDAAGSLQLDSRNFEAGVYIIRVQGRDGDELELKWLVL